jgi:hypothetical protein
MYPYARFCFYHIDIRYFQQSRTPIAASLTAQITLATSKFSTAMHTWLLLSWDQLTRYGGYGI